MARPAGVSWLSAPAGADVPRGQANLATASRRRQSVLVGVIWHESDTRRRGARAVPLAV